MSILLVEILRKSFGRMLVVRDVSFRVSAGEVSAFLRPVPSVDIRTMQRIDAALRNFLLHSVHKVC